MLCMWGMRKKSVLMELQLQQWFRSVILYCFCSPSPCGWVHLHICTVENLCSAILVSLWGIGFCCSKLFKVDPWWQLFPAQLPISEYPSCLSFGICFIFKLGDVSLVLTNCSGQLWQHGREKIGLSLAWVFVSNSLQCSDSMKACFVLALSSSATDSCCRFSLSGWENLHLMP